MILQDIINTLSLPEFYFAVFRSATPVLLTTLGAMIASRSGTNNIALEGVLPGLYPCGSRSHVQAV